MRYFTLSEANRALALIQPIVSDMLEKRNKLMRYERMLRMMRQRPSTQFTLSKVEGLRTGSGRQDVAKLQRTEHEFQKLIEGIEHHVSEIAQVGCILKDIHRGLIDFPSWHEGREMYLCWENGEKEISSWHEVSGGFTGRKPVDATFHSILHEPLSELVTPSQVEG